MERALNKTRHLDEISQFIQYANNDTQAEFETKLLAGRIQTRDTAMRLLKTLQSMTAERSQEHRLTYSYAKDNTRVHVLGTPAIQKVCATKSFAGIALSVERKLKYFDSIDRKEGPVAAQSRDVIDVSDFFVRFTLSTEKFLKKDFDGPVDDPAAHIRVIDRQSFAMPGGEFRVDFSMVKSKLAKKEGIRDVLKNTPAYELEIEYTPRKEARPVAEVRRSLFRILETLLGSFQETHHVLPLSDMQRYAQEFKASGNIFYNPVTLERPHVVRDRPNNILKGYTVTIKADGQRCALYVTRDRKLVRVTPNGQVTYTGFSARDGEHSEDFVDGEYIPEKNLFCIFDIYKYKGRLVKGLPLFTTDDDVRRNPMSSRLGCSRQFVADLTNEFVAAPGEVMRIETKTFLAGDGEAMEECIRKVLDAEYEYETDGCIFTPRLSPVAPSQDTKGRTWRRVYKWKPPHQNSIDFLLKIVPASTYDVVRKQMVREGSLYVSRTPGEDIIYPCETMTGEYVPPKLPADLKSLEDGGTRVPSVFQPSAPRNEDAYKIGVPVNDANVPVDSTGAKVEDNTIVECAYDTEKRIWTVMRTRYDKTYEYRVMGRAQYGNDIYVADSIWTSIHVPITEDMLRTLWTAPPDDTFEDDMYYRDDENTRVRSMVREFHNRIKDMQYSAYVVPGNTLLEIAVGRGGDLHKWRKSKPSKVLGLDISLSNLVMPRQGACVRYLNEKRRSTEFLPKVLFAQADMTKPYEEQESKYLKIVFGDAPATTPYLSEFRGIQEWDVVACQFALHYACETEETFRVFAKNLKHCKNIFFGTFLDGKAVYTLMAGRDNYQFRSRGKTFATMTKRYEDEGTWKEDFGQQIDVLLESTVKPAPEFLVPFEKVQEILREEGFELEDTKSFSEIYSGQTTLTLERGEQDFSFLYRTFVFKRAAPAAASKPVEEEPEAEPAEEPPKEAAAEPVKEAVAPPIAEKKAPVRRKKIVAPPAGAEAPPPPPEIVHFFSKEPENKEFSNFYETKFTLDGVEYNSAEHAYQAVKAKTFGDEEHFKKIVKAKSAQSAKSFGKKVAGYNEEVWTGKKDEVMKSVLRAKFTQNLDIRKKLLDTGDKVLANSDSRDKYWGTGTSASTTMAKDPSKWKGENKLGKFIMELRAELKAEA